MSRHFRVLRFFLVFLVSAWATDAQTINEGVERSVWAVPDNLYYPISIIGIDFDGTPGDCNGRPLRCRIPDQLGDDWMTKMRVKVVNRSPVAVTCVRMRLQIPSVSNGAGNTSDFVINNYLATIGMIPENALIVSAGKVLQVDQEAPIELLPKTADYVPFAHFRRDVVGMPPRPPAPERLKILVYPWDVFFEDGVRWRAGSYVRPDPDKPGTWVSVSGDPKWTPWRPNNN